MPAVFKRAEPIIDMSIPPVLELIIRKDSDGNLVPSLKENGVTTELKYVQALSVSVNEKDFRVPLLTLTRSVIPPSSPAEEAAFSKAIADAYMGWSKGEDKLEELRKAYPDPFQVLVSGKPFAFNTNYDVMTFMGRKKEGLQFKVSGGVVIEVDFNNILTYTREWVRNDLREIVTSDRLEALQVGDVITMPSPWIGGPGQQERYTYLITMYDGRIVETQFGRWADCRVPADVMLTPASCSFWDEMFDNKNLGLMILPYKKESVKQVIVRTNVVK